jgi:hypothetical protein
MLTKLLLICATLSTLKAVYSTERHKVCIEQGELEGTTLTSRNGRTFVAFQGIPYAEPPVGNLRFKVRFENLPKNLHVNRLKLFLLVMALTYSGWIV